METGYIFWATVKTLMILFLYTRGEFLEQLSDSPFSRTFLHTYY